MKTKTKKKAIIQSVLKIILCVVGFFIIVLVVFFIWLGSVFTCGPSKFERFWGKMTDPCYEIEDVTRGPGYKIKNNRVCVSSIIGGCWNNQYLKWTTLKIKNK